MILSHTKLLLIAWDLIGLMFRVNFWLNQWREFGGGAISLTDQWEFGKSCAKRVFAFLFVLKMTQLFKFNDSIYVITSITDAAAMASDIDFGFSNQHNVTSAVKFYWTQTVPLTWAQGNVIIRPALNITQKKTLRLFPKRVWQRNARNGMSCWKEWWDLAQTLPVPLTETQASLLE